MNNKQIAFLKNTGLLIKLAAIFMAVTLLAACSDTKDHSNAIAVSFYPIEYITERIAGNDFSVVNVTPVGAEPHDVELSADKTDLVLNARLTIVLGGGFQPVIEKTAKSRKDLTLNLIEEINHKDEHAIGIKVVNARLSHGGHDHDEDSNENNEKMQEDVDSHDHQKGDPHIWLDPVLMKDVVNIIAEHLIEINPSSEGKYAERRDQFLRELSDLDTEYKNALTTCENKVFVTSHDAFSRLAQRYGLTQEAIAGVSPDNEPSPGRLSELKELVKEKNIKVIFTEELVSDKVAKSLSSEVGVETKVLSPIEGLTDNQIKKKLDYFDLMRGNLKELSQALDCQVVS